MLLPSATEEKSPSVDTAELGFATANGLIYSGSMKGLISCQWESMQIVSLVLGTLGWEVQVAAVFLTQLF